MAVEKVKAHTKWSEVMEERVAHMDHVGNEAANRAAEEALASAKAETPSAAYNAALAMAVLWAKWLLDYTAGWDPRSPEEEVLAEAAIGRAEAEHDNGNKAERNSLSHELWQRKGTTIGEMWAGIHGGQADPHIWGGRLQGICGGACVGGEHWEHQLPMEQVSP